MRAPADRFWIVANPSSGSVTDVAVTALDTAFAEAGLAVAGRTRFPEEPLPPPDAVDRAGATVLALFAGDGTVNAAAEQFAGWSGRLLVLPGGTMNLLAKRLHGEATPGEIVAAIPGRGRTVQLPVVESEGHCAYVGMIAGPWASWVHAREAVREGRLQRAWRATRLAWARGLGPGVRVYGARAGFRSRHQAVFVTPGSELLEVSTVSLDNFLAAARLGANWLTGEWQRSPDVQVSRAADVVLVGPRTVHALFDGEAAKLAAPVSVRHALGPIRFLATKDLP
jgi:diacylglycerol kinase family enzyme